MSRVSSSSSIFSQPVSVKDSTHARRGGVVARGADRGATSGGKGAGKSAISGEASGAAVHNIGEKRKRGGGSSRPPKLPIVGGKGK